MKRRLFFLLGMSLMVFESQVVWGAPGLNEPFTTVDEFKGKIVNGKVTIEGSTTPGPAIGVLSQLNNVFEYTEAPVAIEIKGVGTKTKWVGGVVAYGGKITFGEIDVKMTNDASEVVKKSVIALQATASGEMTIGNNSSVFISGNVDNGFAMTGGIADKLNSTSDNKGKLYIGDWVKVTVVNYGTGNAQGLRAYDNSILKSGDYTNIFVEAVGSARGVETGTPSSNINVNNLAKVEMGKAANIEVCSETENGVGIYVYRTGSFEAQAGLKIKAATKNGDKIGAGVLVDGQGFNIPTTATLNGAFISSKIGDKAGLAIRVLGKGTFVGNAGYYDLDGDIVAFSGGEVDLIANCGSKIKGKIKNSDGANTTGIVNIDLYDDSTWKMAGQSNLNNLRNDNSTIDMTQDGNAFSTLKIENLSGDNGTFVMDINASQNTNNSDKIYVTDTFTGTQYIDLYEINGYTLIGDEGVGTVLATVKNNEGKFLAKDGEGTLYWKRYELDKKETEDTSGAYTTDWYLKGVTNDTETPTTGVETIIAGTALNYHTWRNESDELLKRMGELRHNGEEEQGVWFRVKGSKISRDGKFSFENKYTAYELGYDQITKKTDEVTRYQGAAFSYTDGKSGYRAGSGDNSSKALSFYDTRIGNQGHYLDVVFKISDMKNDFKVYDSNARKITGESNNIGVSLSAEYGRKNDLSKGWYIEPQAQFTLGYLGGDTYQTNNGIEVNESGITSAVGRIGFNIGKEVGNKGIVYAKANLLHEFAGSYDVAMRSGSERLKTSGDFRDTWFEYGVGAAFATSNNSHVYVDVEKSTGSDFKKDWQWNVGARWTF